MDDPVIADLNKYLRNLDYQAALEELAEHQGACKQCGSEDWETQEGCGFWEGYLAFICRACGKLKRERLLRWERQ